MTQAHARILTWLLATILCLGATASYGQEAEVPAPDTTKEAAEAAEAAQERPTVLSQALPRGSEWDVATTITLQTKIPLQTTTSTAIADWGVQVADVKADGSMATKWTLRAFRVESTNPMLSNMVIGLPGREFSIEWTPRGYFASVDTLDFAASSLEYYTLQLVEAVGSIGVLPGVRLAMPEGSEGETEGEESSRMDFSGAREVLLSFGGSSIEEDASWQGVAESGSEEGTSRIVAEVESRERGQQLSTIGAMQVRASSESDLELVFDNEGRYIRKARMETTREITSMFARGNNVQETEAEHFETVEFSMAPVLKEEAEEAAEGEIASDAPGQPLTPNP